MGYWQANRQDLTVPKQHSVSVPMGVRRHNTVFVGWNELGGYTLTQPGVLQRLPVQRCSQQLGGHIISSPNEGNPDEGIRWESVPAGRYHPVAIGVDDTWSASTPYALAWEPHKLYLPVVVKGHHQ